MTNPKVYVGSRGTIIRCNCVDDISDATARVIQATKPDGTVLDWTATADGATHVRYVIPDATVLDMAGVWRFQPIITTPAGEWPGETGQLKVYDRGA